MKIKKYKALVFGEPCVVELMSFTKSDAKEWKKLFDLWKELKLGMRKYRSREPNLPEGLSETAFCLYSGSKRFVSLSGNSSASFDTFNLSTHHAEQIKATSISEDVTSFGPKSRWDDLYFLDFYNNGKLDGSFNVYKIPTELILNTKVNRIQTFQDQQKQGRRPRFSITKKIIRPYHLKPLATNVRIWQ